MLSSRTVHPQHRPAARARARAFDVVAVTGGLFTLCVSRRGRNRVPGPLACGPGRGLTRDLLLCPISMRGMRDAVRDALRRYVTARIGDRAGVLVADETGFIKKGRRSAGVAAAVLGDGGAGAVQPALRRGRAVAC
jgi:hypothetical protein